MLDSISCYEWATALRPCFCPGLRNSIAIDERDCAFVCKKLPGLEMKPQFRAFLVNFGIAIGLVVELHRGAAAFEVALTGIFLFVLANALLLSAYRKRRRAD